MVQPYCVMPPSDWNIWFSWMYSRANHDTRNVVQKRISTWYALSWMTYALIIHYQSIRDVDESTCIEHWLLEWDCAMNFENVARMNTDFHWWMRSWICVAMWFRQVTRGLSMQALNVQFFTIWTLIFLIPATTVFTVWDIPAAGVFNLKLRYVIQWKSVSESWTWPSFCLYICKVLSVRKDDTHVLSLVKTLL